MPFLKDFDVLTKRRVLIVHGRIGIKLSQEANSRFTLLFVRILRAVPYVQLPKDVSQKKSQIFRFVLSDAKDCRRKLGHSFGEKM